MAYNDLGLASDAIIGITKISGATEAGSVDTYRITTRSGLTSTFQVVNGANGTNKNVYKRDFDTFAAFDTFMQQYAKNVMAVFYVDGSSSTSAPLVYSVSFFINQNTNVYEFGYYTASGTFVPLSSSNVASNKLVRIYAFDESDPMDGLDTELDVNSLNPVTNRAITASLGQPKGYYATLSDLNAAIPSGDQYIYVVKETNKWYYWNGAAWTVGDDFRGLIGEDYLKKGDYDATTAVGYADEAGNLKATKGLTVNDDPMSFGIVGGAQKSAVGDGNATLNKLVCVDVVKNQLISSRSSETKDGITFTSNGDGSYNVSGTATGTTYFGNWFPNFINGHKYLLIGCPSGGDLGKYMFDTGAGIGSDYGAGNIGTFNGTTGQYYVRLYVYGGQTISGIFRPLLIDLTQRYGNNDVVNAIIGTDASTQVARLLSFDHEILNDTDYDAGTMIPSKVAKLLSVGVNQWDEEWKLGILESIGSATNLRSKNPIKVFPGTQYFIKCPNNTVAYIFFYDINGERIGDIANYVIKANETFTTPANAEYIQFVLNSAYGSIYNHDISINVSDPNINGKYYKHTRTVVTLPNYEGHGILKVVDGKVVADGDELYPDGTGKNNMLVTTFTLETNWNRVQFGGVYLFVLSIAGMTKDTGLLADYTNNQVNHAYSLSDKQFCCGSYDYGSSWLSIRDDSVETTAAFATKMAGKTLISHRNTPQDITTPVFQSTFPVEQGGTLQFLDENDNPIAGLQGSEIFYQKNIKTFVEALGEATDWDPERIKRLGNLSFTPEYVDITLNPSPTDAYARAQVYNATFTIVISAALTGAHNGSITFQDSEVDLSNFQTKPAESIYDMDGKKVSEAPTTADCNIASFVGRSKSGIVLWSLLHSGVNKVKIHIEEPVPLDNDGNGKIDCRASLIL